MTSENIIRVLLIDDDEDAFVITGDYLGESRHTRFNLDWVDNYADAERHLAEESHDVFLIDYRLGPENGLDLIRTAVANSCHKPLILLTGQADKEIEIEALELGAADYLVKGQFSSAILERTILYGIKNKRILTNLALSEARYRAVVESQNELICRFRPDATLTFVNGAYCRTFGKKAAELIGQSLLSIIAEDQLKVVQDRLKTILMTRGSVTYENEVTTSVGETRWQRWTDQAILDEDGKIVEIQSVGVDISDQKKAEFALRKALEQERELGELKSRFVTMASHEFRTPLTTIMSTASYLEMTESQISPEKRVARLQKIQNACRGMTNLLDDVLIYGRTEVSRVDFSPEMLDVVEFSNEIFEDIQAGSGKKHQFIFKSDAPTIQAGVDEKLLRQILTNLLTNAVKYSPAGSAVTLTVSCEKETLRLMVEDQGIGIPIDDQKHIFEPFHRANNIRDIAGTGLGLAISKTAAEVHNGQIKFTTGEGRGTTFIVDLPLSQV